MQQIRKTRTVPKMSETERAREDAEFNERLSRARRASTKARRAALQASRLVAQVDRMV
jgi:hypothetical protein